MVRELLSLIFASMRNREQILVIRSETIIPLLGKSALKNDEIHRPKSKHIISLRRQSGHAANIDPAFALVDSHLPGVPVHYFRNPSLISADLSHIEQAHQSWRASTKQQLLSIRVCLDSFCIGNSNPTWDSCSPTKSGPVDHLPSSKPSLSMRVSPLP